jgi:hypothetical protein
MIDSVYLRTARAAMRDRVIASANASVTFYDMDKQQTAYGQTRSIGNARATMPCRVSPLPSSEVPDGEQQDGVEFRLLSISADAAGPSMSEIARINGVDWQIVGIRTGPSGSVTYITISRPAL